MVGIIIVILVFFGGIDIVETEFEFAIPVADHETVSVVVAMLDQPAAIELIVAVDLFHGAAGIGQQRFRGGGRGAFFRFGSGIAGLKSFLYFRFLRSL